MIRLLIAEDEHLIRGALKALLSSEDDLRIVADTGEGRQVLPLALKHHTDVAVLDVNLPDMNGLDVASQLHENLPHCRTLLLTSLASPGTVRQALELGVRGYLLKDAAPSELATAIRKVAVDQRVIAPELMLAAWGSRSSPLTPRETDILGWAAEGMSVGDIATIARLSSGTVRNYLSSCITKLGARSRLDAVRICQDSGWLLSGTRSTPDRGTQL